jgi:putative transposase
MAMEYQRDEHRVHLIVYHLIFCPKRRKSVLVGDIGRDCERLIRQKCVECGWEVINLAVMPDHVHLFVRVFPTNAAADVVQAVKGFTSHELRAKYPQLNRLPSLWTRSYFASSAGNVSGAIIDHYIAAQKGA